MDDTRLEQYFYITVMTPRSGRTMSMIASNAILSKNYIDIIRDYGTSIEYHQWLALIGLIETVYIKQHK